MEKVKDYLHIEDAKKCLEAGQSINLPSSIVEAMNILLKSYDKIFMAIENPSRQIRYIVEAKKRLSDFVDLLPNIDIGKFPVNKILESNKSYLEHYLDEFHGTMPDLVIRPLTFNLIKRILDNFRENVERHIYRVFKVTENPKEEIGWVEKKNIE